MMKHTTNRHSHKKNGWLMAYVCMPLILAAIGGAALYIGLKPVLQTQVNTLNMLFNNGEIYYSEEIVPVITEVKEEKKVIETQPADVKKQEVEEPNIGDQYGQLACERLGINEPVYFGDNPDVLNLGIGTYPVSWIPGCGKTTLLSGHNNMALSVIADAQVGDEFTFTTDYGVYKYRVSDFTIVDETDIDACKLDEDKEQVVIYTCYPFYRISGRRTQRYFVYLEKLSGPEIELTNYFLKD